VDERWESILPNRTIILTTLNPSVKTASKNPSRGRDSFYEPFFFISINPSHYLKRIGTKLASYIPKNRKKQAGVSDHEAICFFQSLYHFSNYSGRFGIVTNREKAIERRIGDLSGLDKFEPFLTELSAD